MAINEMTGVCKNYRLGKTEVKALSDVTVSIEEGDFISIAGPSGSGKTTMLNMLGCLDKPTSGSIAFMKNNINEMKPGQLADIRNAHIGFVFQSFNLIPVLTAFENVEFPLILQKNKNVEERAKHVNEILDEVGIGELKHRRPSDMSGGQQQRVAIARALVKNPKLVLADEPTANLDSKTGENILKLMLEINKSHKTTFVFSTHDPMVMNFAKRLIKLHDGQIASDEKR